MSHLTRRRFLEGSLITAGGLLFTKSYAKTASPSPRRVLGANDTIRVAVAGLNGRGAAHIEAFLGMKNVEIAYLVDPDSRLFASRSKRSPTSRARLLQQSRTCAVSSKIRTLTSSRLRHPITGIRC